MLAIYRCSSGSRANADAKDATLRGMLFDLESLDVVRVIEDVEAPRLGSVAPEEAGE